MGETQPQQIRIALAEDEPDQRRALAALLKAMNYTPHGLNLNQQ